jgi:hypothetical protein
MSGANGNAIPADRLAPGIMTAEGEVRSVMHFADGGPGEYTTAVVYVGQSEVREYDPQEMVPLSRPEAAALARLDRWLGPDHERRRDGG